MNKDKRYRKTQLLVLQIVAAFLLVSFAESRINGGNCRADDSGAREQFATFYEPKTKSIHDAYTNIDFVVADVYFHDGAVQQSRVTVGQSNLSLEKLQSIAIPTESLVGISFDDFEPLRMIGRELAAEINLDSEILVRNQDYAFEVSLAEPSDYILASLVQRNGTKYPAPPRMSLLTSPPLYDTPYSELHEDNSVEFVSFGEGSWNSQTTMRLRLRYNVYLTFLEEPSATDIVCHFEPSDGIILAVQGMSEETAINERRFIYEGETDNGMPKPICLQTFFRNDDTGNFFLRDMSVVSVWKSAGNLQAKEFRLPAYGIPEPTRFARKNWFTSKYAVVSLIGVILVVVGVVVWRRARN